MNSLKYILIIDDEIAVIESLKSQIQSIFGKEFIYEVATSAEEGLTIVNELLNEDIDILITISDWLMPGMKGDEFLIELHKLIPEAIKLMVTGHATQDAIQRAYLEANLYQVLYKPWNEKQLIAIIKDAISK